MTALGYIQLVSEILAFFASLMVAGSLMRNKWWLWIPYLFYTCVIEIFAAFSKVTAPKVNNLWLYNPYIIVSLTFYGWFVLHNTELSAKTRKLLYLTGAAISLSCMLWYIVMGDPETLISSILNFGALIICIFCLLFFYMHIKNPVKYNSLTDVPAFWMVSGILVFHTGISIYVAIYGFLADAKIRIWDTTIQNLIPQVLSLFLYSSIIAGLIKWRYQLKS